MNAYIKLTNSTETLIKKFRTLHAGYRPIRERVGNQRLTITGHIDNQIAVVIRRWRYVIKVYETDPTDPSGTDSDTEGYGTLAHLKTFFNYTDADGAPSNLITLTDHYGDDHLVYFATGVISEEPYTTALEGVTASFSVSAELLEAYPNS